jgi:zinc finger protein
VHCSSLFDWSYRGRGVLLQVMSFPVSCTDCSAPGETRMCMTDIPHFKEIIIMSFLCDDCGYRTVEVKGGGAVPDHGTKTTLRVDVDEHTEMDMKRDVIKSDTASIEIPELELELSHGSLGGIYTTVRPRSSR